MVATIYGRYAPRSDERDRWEKIAAALDVEREKARKVGDLGTAMVPAHNAKRAKHP
jgi:hypothetical protein